MEAQLTAALDTVARYWLTANAEQQKTMQSYLLEAIQGPKEPQEPKPDDRDRAEPTEALQADSFQFETEEFIARSITGDPCAVGATITLKGSSLGVLHEIEPTPLRGYKTGLAQGSPVDWSTTWGYRDQILVESNIMRARSRSGRPKVESIELLTRLDEAPPHGFLRPGYCDIDPDRLFSVDDVLWDRLPKIKNPGGEPVFYHGGGVTKRAVKANELFSKGPWIDHMPGWVGRELHPTNQMPMDGKHICEAVGLGTLLAMTDHDAYQPFIYGLIQYGIDLFSIVKYGGHENFIAGGQHGSGRLWPILFAGMMLDDEEMLNIRFFPKKVAFNEIDQTFFVSQEDVNLGYGKYQEDEIGTPEWGNQHARPAGPFGTRIGRGQDDSRWAVPQEDPNWQHLRYRTADTASTWWGWVLAAQLMGLLRYVNHPALPAYLDRYWEVQVTKPDALQQTKGQVWALNMWKTYRDQGVNL